MRTIADSYRDEGVNKGVAQGISQGIAIGKNEGIAIGEARGEARGVEKGIEKGIEKGTYQRNVEIARRMLQEKTDIKFISSVTGLATDDILKIQNKM